MATGCDVASHELAAAGGERVAWARGRMPVLERLRSRFQKEGRFAGVRVGACLHVTPETAVLLGALRAGGAEIALCASNPLTTNDEVAAYLASEGVATFARRGEDADTYLRHVDAVIETGPELTVDDGCDLVARLHSGRGPRPDGVRGGTEDTTTGAVRLRALAASGGLAYPVLALATSAVRLLADNRHGTGQSTLDGIIRATSVLFAGATVVVAGYGNCGKSIAQRARGLGSLVIVTEIDPGRALEAVLDGFSVLPMAEAARVGQVFVTATGNRDVLSGEHFSVMRDGAVLANAGHFDVEIDLPALAGMASERRVIRPGAEQFSLGGSRRLFLLSEGRVVNLAAAEGNPPSVMDVSFSVQALACEWLLDNAADLEAALYDFPSVLDLDVARLSLAAMRITIDEETEAQRQYQATWGIGR